MVCIECREVIIIANYILDKTNIGFYIGCMAKTKSALNLSQLAKHFSDENAARLLLERMRWPDGPVCPICGQKDTVYRMLKLASSKKPVRMEIYEKGYHDFVVGPQGHEGRSEPLMDSTLDALEKTVEFLKQYLKS